MKYTEADTASMAAYIWPGLYKTRPAKAIKKAIEMQRTVERMRASTKEEKVKTKPQAIDLGRRVPYTRGVKEITGEKNRERALPKFKRFMAAKFPNDGEAEIRIGDHERRGFTLNQIIKYIRDYQPWWKLEKSNSARQSALTKKKHKGRVRRPKSDLRFKENRRHKRGYCQVCSERVRQGERLCDDCLSGKPLLLTTEDPSVIASTRQDAGRARQHSDRDQDDGEREKGAKGGLLKPGVMDEAYRDIYERLDGASD